MTFFIILLIVSFLFIFLYQSLKESEKIILKNKISKEDEKLKGKEKEPDKFLYLIKNNNQILKKTIIFFLIVILFIIISLILIIFSLSFFSF